MYASTNWIIFAAFVVLSAQLAWTQAPPPPPPVVVVPPMTMTSLCTSKIPVGGVDVCLGLEKCSDDKDCAAACIAKGLPASCLVCTKITMDFLFNQTVTDVGGKDQFNDKFKVCRPMKYEDTIQKLLNDNFYLKPGDPCDTRLHDRFLSDRHLSTDPTIPYSGRYVKSLKDRLESLELFAWQDAANSKMCNLKEFSYCPVDSVNPGTEKCVCFYGNNFTVPGTTPAVQTCRSSQFEDCDLTVPVFDKNDAKKYPKSPFSEDVLHLPMELTTAKYKLECGTTADSDNPIQLNCMLNKCQCPTEITCSAASEDSLWEYTHDPRYIPAGGDIHDVTEYTKALDKIEKKMTGVIGDECSPGHETKLAIEWDFILKYAYLGNKVNTKLVKDAFDQQIKLLKEVIEVDPPLGVHRLCKLKKQFDPTTKKEVIIREKKDNGVAQRLICEKDPDSGTSYCVGEYYNKAKAAEIFAMLSQPQLRGDSCDPDSEKILIETINYGRALFHRFDMNPTGTEKDVRDFTFKLLKLQRDHPLGETKLCSNNGKDNKQGLRCSSSSKCECGEDFEWSEQEKNCFVKIGRSCRECINRKPFLSCTRDHACVKGSTCLAPHGSSMDSKQCIPETIPAVATPFIKATASTVIAKSKLLFVLGLQLFF